MILQANAVLANILYIRLFCFIIENKLQSSGIWYNSPIQKVRIRQAALWFFLYFYEMSVYC